MEFGRKLSEARRRLIRQQYLDYVFPGLAGAVFGIFLGRLWRIPLEQVVPPALGLALVAAALAAFWRWRREADVAEELDRRTGSKDRFCSALALQRDPGAWTLADSALREINAYASALGVREAISLKVPRTALWILLPLACLAALELWRDHRAKAIQPELAQAEEMVRRAQELAEEEAKKDPELEEIARELAQAAQQLKESSDPLREAMKALSGAERKLASAEQEGLDAAAAEALAAGLSESHPQLAENLRAQDYEEAARQVSTVDPEELAKALEQAARHLENARLRRMAQSGRAQMQKQMIGMLQSGQGAQGRRRLLSGLQDMKNGRMAGNQGAGEQNPAEGPGNGKDGKNAQSNPDGQAPPSGAPGSEKDFGEGSDIAGQQERRSLAHGSDEFLEGTLGEGGATSQTIQFSGNEEAAARRQFRSAYEKAAPAELDAVEQENIPAGSRSMVRRYFEAIRPKE